MDLSHIPCNPTPRLSSLIYVFNRELIMITQLANIIFHKQTLIKNEILEWTCLNGPWSSKCLLFFDVGRPDNVKQVEKRDSTILLLQFWNLDDWNLGIRFGRNRT
jgi:hypothetical protein